MTGNLAFFKKNDEKVDEQVSNFLKDMKAGSGRLIFALDATGSRKPTWDLASNLQARMFEECAGLSLQLIYYRGFGECKATDWVTNPTLLAKKMATIDCLGGTTQIGRILTHAQNETAKQKVGAMVFVGDALEESPDTLIVKARELGRLTTPVFMFQEGQDANVESTFRDVAQSAGGAYGRFDSGAAKQLSELLKAVALFATGGLTALEARKDLANIHLIEQLRGSP